MKNKKGFTLVELLAVLVILGILLAIIIPTMTGIISDSKDNLHNEQAGVVEKAANMWYLESDVDLENDESCKISVSYLIDNGYIEGEDIIDPKTGDPMTGYVVIKYLNKQYTYTYFSSSTVANCE